MKTCVSFRTATTEKQLPESGNLVNQSSIPDPQNGPKYRGIRTKLAKASGEKKQSSPKLKRMTEVELRSPKQIIKPEKLRGVADGERKIPVTVEPSPPTQQDKLNIMEVERDQKQKAKSPNEQETAQTYQETPTKMTNSTGIPKPMAAVKGTTKTTSSTDISSLKTKSPSIPRISLDIDKQKRDDVCVAMVSPMRTSVNDEIKINDEEKRIIGEPDKKLKDVEEEEVMNVKPMSPLMNGYRLGGHSSLHYTHPGCINNVQTNKTIYYSEVKQNPNFVNLESIDLARGRLIAVLASNNLVFAVIYLNNLKIF